MQQINFSKINYDKLSQGKCTTVVLGSASLTLGKAFLKTDEAIHGIAAEITEVRIVRLKDLGLTDAVSNGFNSIEELRRDLETCYQKCVSMTEVVTQVRFKI